MNGKSSFTNNYNFSGQFIITQLIAWHDTLANKHTQTKHIQNKQQLWSCKLSIYVKVHSYISHVMRKPVYAIREQHPCSLISTFVFCCLDSIIPLVSISKISSLYIASLAVQAGLSLTWSETPKTGFLMTGLILV